MSGQLAGKVAIITGGNSGIGEATCYRFAKEGARVLLLARREKESVEVQNSIKRDGGEATFIHCDVGDVESVEAAVTGAAATYGTIDILFNNAGGGGGGNFPNSSTDSITAR